MKISVEEAEMVVNEDYCDWEPVKGTEEIYDQGRWTTSFTGVFKHVPTGKHYIFDWTRGSTECQDGQELFPFCDNDNNIEVQEVEEKEVLVKQWVAVKATEVSHAD